MTRLGLFLAATLFGTLLTSSVQAGHPVYRAHADRGAYWYNANHSWHGAYQHVQWGHPLALIVPPTANMQTDYSWGVGRTTMRPIHHQFGRPIATPGYAGGLQPSPVWPSNTQQIGVYYSRGPW